MLGELRVYDTSYPLSQAVRTEPRSWLMATNGYVNAPASPAFWSLDNERVAVAALDHAGGVALAVEVEIAVSDKRCR